MESLHLPVAQANYQIPRPISIIPKANQPITPTEMIVSSVMRESEELGVGFELESAGFMTDGKFPRYQIDGHKKLSKVHAF
ncbi:MAG: hypothetical protein H8K03_14785 [Nitrospira sp.]